MFYLLGFISTIFFANWLIGNVGDCSSGLCVISVGFGFMAPSGVLAVGLGFTLRDLVQRRLGISWTIAGILIGAALSAWLSPALALASGISFLLSEALDLLVYSPFQERYFLVAVVSSNMVGAVVDSVVFLMLAGFGLAFLPGQVVGKILMTLVALPIVWMMRWIEAGNEAI